MEPEKHRQKLLHVTLYKVELKFNQATDWPHSNINVINIWPRNSESKNRAETRSRYGATAFSAFFLCVPCVSASHTPAIPVPLSQIRQHCYCDNYNAYILKQRSIGQVQKCTFPLPMWAQSMHRAIHSPPECRIPANVNGLDITSCTLHSDEV